MRTTSNQWITAVLSLSISASTLASIPGCSSEEGSSMPGETPSPNGTAAVTSQCKYKDRGTQFAPCKTDSDCFSGFCDKSGNPGPYCYVPTRIARDNGHGYGCSTNAECEEVAPDVVSRGGQAECRNDSVYSGCLFICSQ
jgi:hypothetical protein